MLDTVYRVRVLDRAFSIVNLLSLVDQPMGASEIGQNLHLNKTTVHRLLAVLEHHRYVERDSLSGRYRLGLKLAELGNLALSRFDLQRIARPYIERLVKETGETAHLGIMQQNEVISLVNVETQHSLRSPSTVGRRSPLHCTSQGKVLLASLPPQQVEQALRGYRFVTYTGRTLRNPAALRTELSKVRQSGYAVDNEEFEEGLRCIGAPVRDHTARVIAAISIAGPRFRITSECTPSLVRKVMRVASDLSETLGYNGLQSGSRSNELVAAHAAGS
jgi:DNA-binding IclR family transcriptional regulator